jgi:UDP-2,4-diacetamido-2,4,6-trideoxy-beta-L-altropyranose hydrolase
MSDVLLRPLKPEDCELLFIWRNDPWIVSLSAGRQTVSLHEHEAWFAKAIKDENVFIQIISNGDVDMGSVRVERLDKVHATITIYLMQPFIGYGKGSRAIGMACKEAFLRWPLLKVIYAWIRLENMQSRNAFFKLGFLESESKVADSRDEDMMRLQLLRMI